MKKIYKLLISIIFKKIYGDVRSIYKKSSNFIVKSFNIENKRYYLLNIKNCRIFTDSTNNAAFLVNNTLIKEVSYQIISNANSNIKKNSVFKRGTPKLLKKKEGPVLSLITGGGANNNYWHWMYDTVSRLRLVEEVYKLNYFNCFLVPDIKYGFQKQTLDLLGIRTKSISSKQNKHIFSKEIIATNHPWQFSKNPHFDIENVPNWITGWLRNKFLRFKSKKKFYKKIYIDRSDSKFNKINQRQIINEKEIKKKLIKKKFKILKLSNFSITDQIGIFNSAEIIIGNHGAGFTNLIFCKKGTKVIEFVDKNTAKIFKKISKDLNLNYHSVLGKRIEKDRGDQNNNLIISSKKIMKLIS